MTEQVPVVDLFSGPGGLAEGFASFMDPRGRPRFNVALSIEMEPTAYRTLLLRGFLRKFSSGYPAEYYDFLNGDVSREPDWTRLYPREWQEACDETRCLHAFQGRTVDNVIAVMEAKHPKLSTQKSFYVEISRARHSAELVTDDAKELRETLEAATGERVSALEGIGAAEKALAEERARAGGKERGRGLEGLLERPSGTRDEPPDRGREPEREKAPEQERTAELDRSRGSRGIEMEM